MEGFDANLGDLRTVLGPTWELLGPKLGGLGSNWGQVELMLGGSEPTWELVGPTWELLGPPQDNLGANLELKWEVWGERKSNFVQIAKTLKHQKSLFVFQVLLCLYRASWSLS